MKNFLIIVLVILAAGLAYIFFTKDDTPVVQKRDTPLVLSASFVCKDGSDFKAEFPDASTVKIYSSNFLILPLVEGAGKRFENNDVTYVFAGEEVTVTNKKTNQTTTCEQLFDESDAPVNFGDAGEGGGEKQDVGLIVTESIIGKWQSTDNKNYVFVREFRADGTLVNTENGKSAGLMQGNWKIFTKEKPLEVSFPLESDVVYVQIILVGTQDGGTENFKIGKLTPESLELIDMARGETLHFIRA